MGIRLIFSCSELLFVPEDAGTKIRVETLGYKHCAPNGAGRLRVFGAGKKEVKGEQVDFEENQIKSR
jgi:hypothetical protein